MEKIEWAKSMSLLTRGNNFDKFKNFLQFWKVYKIWAVGQLVTVLVTRKEIGQNVNTAK